MGVQLISAVDVWCYSEMKTCSYIKLHCAPCWDRALSEEIEFICGNEKHCMHSIVEILPTQYCSLYSFKRQTGCLAVFVSAMFRESHIWVELITSVILWCCCCARFTRGSWRFELTAGVVCVGGLLTIEQQSLAMLLGLLVMKCQKGSFLFFPSSVTCAVTVQRAAVFV